MHSDLLLGLVIAAALAFDFTNGFHDTANVVASSISTRALPPRTAIGLASLLNFAGAFISLKVAATINNAKAYLRLREEGSTLDHYLWSFVDHRPIVNDWPGGARPAKTELSDRISKDLAKRGFKFVGSTIVYAYMQGIGMVDDHDRDCICRARR